MAASKLNLVEQEIQQYKEEPDKGIMAHSTLMLSYFWQNEGSVVGLVGRDPDPLQAVARGAVPDRDPN